LNFFHYILFAHNVGEPKNACLTPTGGVDSACQTANASPNSDFHTPTARSGVGDFPGGDALVTFGLWPFVSDFVVGSTMAHELGHNMWRSHSGDPFAPVERNCNSNYISIMNYFFQKDGVESGRRPAHRFLSRETHQSQREQPE
jgi:hypothetical protein